MRLSVTCALRRRWSNASVISRGLIIDGALGCAVRLQATFPSETAMHRPGEPSDEMSSDSSIVGKETWSQFASRVRHGRRRVRVVDITAKMSYEYQMLKRLCRRRPNMRQWTIRDDLCNMSPGVVVMSPSMQAAFMRVFRLKDKAAIRRCLRDIIPIIEFRNREERQQSLEPEALIPEGQPDALNQKKRELFERRVLGDNLQPTVLHDTASQAKLRRKIRNRLIRFQRQLSVSNAISSRSVLYSADDAIGYFLFRGPAMYAGVHRVLFELSKLMPHFVPKTLLDFGAGTGTAIMAAKEVYSPGSMAYPLYRSTRQTFTSNEGSQSSQLDELRYDLQRLERNNQEKKKARFMAVAALLQNGEVEASELPQSLRQEIASVAHRASEARKSRLRREEHARHRDVVDGSEWTDSDPTGRKAATTERPEDKLPGEEGEGEDGTGNADAGDAATWWERFIRSEESSLHSKSYLQRLRPLQEVTAVEPSPGMMETGVMVLHEDCPNVAWKRYLMPEDETVQYDMVIAAYALSEVGEEEQRMKLVKQLWNMTGGVLVLVEFASLGNFDMLMKARDAILEEKGVGLWDWQPTIVAPCPHELRCPMRHSKAGVKRKAARVCHTVVNYRSTFVEVWARHVPLKISIEPISYLVIARNEAVPQRAAERSRLQEEALRREASDREAKQREFYEASLGVKGAVFERLSDEALNRPNHNSGVPPKLSLEAKEGSASDARLSGASSAGLSANEVPRETLAVRTSDRRENWLARPEAVPAPLHKFNRGFVDAGFQRTRAISPQEMLTVRSEAADTRRRFQEKFPAYLRVVSDPVCRGRVQADFCTPAGDLIRGRVYRRYYGDGLSSSSGANEAAHHSLRWQHVGGWKLLRKIRRGSLFPNDVPLYCVTRYPQVDYPNTLADKKLSHVQKTAMQLNDPLDIRNVPEADLTVEDLKLKRMAERDEEQMRRANEQIEAIMGTKIADRGAGEVNGARVDNLREISAEQWSAAVRRAQQRVVRHSKRSIPNAAKIRDAKRLIRNQARKEQRLNRQRRD